MLSKTRGGHRGALGSSQSSVLTRSLGRGDPYTPATPTSTSLYCLGAVMPTSPCSWPEPRSGLLTASEVGQPGQLRKKHLQSPHLLPKACLRSGCLWGHAVSVCTCVLVCLTEARPRKACRRVRPELLLVWFSGCGEGGLRENRFHGNNFHVNQRWETFTWLRDGVGG